MASIVNGLFAARSGIGSHGLAIGVVGDNIANASTIGFKASRADFADLLSGGQPTGKTVGSGSQITSVIAAQEQGTLEFTSRSLDVGIDGKGFFVVADGAQRFFTRAGNFKVDSAGYLVTQDNLAVLGYPTDGNGSLEPLNVNVISQTGVETRSVSISGNVDASAPLSGTIPTAANAGTVPATETVTFQNLSDASQFSTVVDVFDSLGAAHTLTFFFFHTATNTYQVRAYANSEDVDPSGTSSGFPRFVGQFNMNFNSDGTRSNTPAIGTGDLDNVQIPWNNGSDATIPLDITLKPFTQFSSSSGVLSITQDGRGVGAITSLSIESDGRIFGVLDNGQTSLVGTLGMANFSNIEGLSRVGKNLLQKTVQSGEPVYGRPQTGTFGSLQAGTVELSNVDIATEFVRLITLQRGFQANSRIISTINQLLSDIVQIV